MTTTPTPGLVEQTYFHRLAIAAPDYQEFINWFGHLLGTVSIDDRYIQPHGIPFGLAYTPTQAKESGADLNTIWLGQMPFVVFSADGPDSPIASFIEKFGTALHSVAWHVPDLWKADSTLRRHGYRLTGYDIPGRHFFIHPADTSWMLIELSDTHFAQDPRDYDDVLPERPADAIVQGANFAWLTMAAEDPRSSADNIAKLFETSEESGYPTDPNQEVIDLKVYDIITRFTKRDTSSSDRDYLHSMCFSVPDLADTCDRLRAAGIRVTSQTEISAWTDAADTHGLLMQWVREDSLPN